MKWIHSAVEASPSCTCTLTVMNTGGCSLPLNDREWCRCWADHHQSRWDEAALSPGSLRFPPSSEPEFPPVQHTCQNTHSKPGSVNEVIKIRRWSDRWWQTFRMFCVSFHLFVHSLVSSNTCNKKNVHMTVCHNQHLNSSLEIHTAFISKKFAKKSLLFSTLWVIFQCMKMSSFRTSLYSATASAERRVYKSCCYAIMSGCMLPWLHYGAVPPPYLTLWGNRAALSENHTKYNSQVKSPSFI